MKKLYNLFIAVLPFVTATLIFGCSGTKSVSNEQVTDSTILRNMIAAQTFVFVPQYASPMGFRKRYLTGSYDISVQKDTVISYLPYFGRAYTAPLSPTDVDFDFTSTKFSYTITPNRKGWNVSIKPRDQSYLEELYFTIYTNGSASLNVISINKSFISYDGYIAVKRSIEKKK